MLPWFWILPGVLAILVILQQVWMFRIRRNARHREELFQIVTENAADMIALVDTKGRRLYNSPAYKRILGYSPAELGETSSFEQIHPDDRFRVLDAAREARETGIGKRLEYRIKHKDGSWRVLESVASTVRDGNGDVAKLVIVNRDVTERRRAEQQLEHSQGHDPLTGLPNRRLFLDRLAHLFTQSRRSPDRHYALLLANLDRFKLINETMGTAAGDQVLFEITRRIGACLRQDDAFTRCENNGLSFEGILSRVGGDEFTILLDCINDPSDAMRVANRLQAAIAQPFSIESREVTAAASIGIALAAPSHQDAEDILKDADVALRRAKALGGSRCEVFDEALHNRAVERLRLEAELRTAMVKQQFRVYFQPIVELDTKRVVSFEALLRWDHPSHGLISPGRFLDAAEDSGLLISIGHWLMLQGCRQVGEWDLRWPSSIPITLTLNLSARQFADTQLVADIQRVLSESGVNPLRLQLEITENIAAADAKRTARLFSELRRLGIRIVLDDFGTGCSSLCGLWQFPVDGLKIDRSVVRELHTDTTASGIAGTILAVGQKMNLRIIAEGIESAKQAERLRELGCNLGQGYFYSKPLDAEATLQFLRDHNLPRAKNKGSAS